MKNKHKPGTPAVSSTAKKGLENLQAECSSSTHLLGPFLTSFLLLLLTLGAICLYVQKVFMKLKWVYLMDTLSEMCRYKWHFRVSELVSRLLVDPICPADKWEDCDTNNYRNKLNLESGNQAVLSISSITLSRQCGGPLAEGLHFSTITVQGDRQYPRLHNLVRWQVEKT